MFALRKLGSWICVHGQATQAISAVHQPDVEELAFSVEWGRTAEGTYSQRNSMSLRRERGEGNCPNLLLLPDVVGAIKPTRGPRYSVTQSREPPFHDKLSLTRWSILSPRCSDIRRDGVANQNENTQKSSGPKTDLD
jgi:hypothetical protein